MPRRAVVVWILFVVELPGCGQGGRDDSATSGDSAKDEADVSLNVETRQAGDEVLAFCPDDGSYELGGWEPPPPPGVDVEEAPIDGDTAAAVVAELVAGRRAATDPERPDIDDATSERLRLYYWPGHQLAMSETTTAGRSTFFEVEPPSSATGLDDPAPSGTDRWSLGLAEVRLAGDRYYLAELVLCTDAIVTRDGQR